MRGNLACPVREGADGKGPEPRAPRRRPTSLDGRELETEHTKQWPRQWDILTGNRGRREGCRRTAVAKGVFAPGHLGKLTQVLDFGLFDAVAEETGTVQRRTRLLPTRVVVYFVLALVLFEHCGYRRVWAMPPTRDRGKARSKKNPTNKYSQNAGRFPRASLRYTITTHVTIMDEGLTARSKR